MRCSHRKTTTNYEAVEKAALGVAALKPSYMSVTYGAGGSTRGYTIKIAEKIQKEQQVTTIAHLTCVGATKADIHAALGQMKEAGIENILGFAETGRRTLREILMWIIIMPPSLWKRSGNMEISVWVERAIRKDILMRQRGRKTF